jgi:hypothetical protein
MREGDQARVEFIEVEPVAHRPGERAEFGRQRITRGLAVKRVGEAETHRRGHEAEQRCHRRVAERFEDGLIPRKRVAVFTGEGARDETIEADDAREDGSHRQQAQRPDHHLRRLMRV